MAKILIAYYSRTGTTKKVAEAIQKALDCDIEEISSIKNRRGIRGYLISGKEGMMRTTAEIERIQKNPANYDAVIIGTPVWSWNLSSPVRAYLRKNSSRFRAVAFFCTMGSNAGKTFSEMQKEVKKIPLATMELQTKDVIQNEFLEKTSAFVHKIHSSI